MADKYEDVTEEEKEEKAPYAERLVVSENKGVALRIRIEETLIKIGENTDERTRSQE